MPNSVGLRSGIWTSTILALELIWNLDVAWSWSYDGY